MFVPFFSFWNLGLHDLGVRKFIASRSSALGISPAILLPPVIARNVSPFEKSDVHLDISETAAIYST